MPSVNKTPNIGLSQWQGNEYIKRQDVVNDNAAVDAAIGNRTIDDTKVPNSDNHTSLSMLLSWLGNMIKSITGKSSWRTAPVKSIEQLNNDIVTHEAEITSLQNEVQNTLSRASVSLSNTAPVQSFTADVAGPVDVEFTAPEMIANSVVNGNFANGTAGWQGNSTTISATNNTLSATCNSGVTPNPNVENVTSITPVIGKKAYIRAKVRVTNSLCQSLVIYTYNGTTAQYSQPISNPAQNNWYKLSGIITQSDLGNRPVLSMFIANVYGDGATAIGKTMEVQEVMYVDLTSIFGAGNEPSQAWCDANISYVNGIQPLVNPMVKNVGRNIISIKDILSVMGSYAYITKVDGRNILAMKGGIQTILPYKFKPNTQYTWNCVCRATGSKNGGTFYIVYTDETSTPLYPGSQSYTKVTVTSAFGKSIKCISISFGEGSSINYYDIETLQLEEDIVSTSYETHKESSAILPGEFCKIGSYADTVKLENGVAKKLAAVKKVMLDGSLGWTYGSDKAGFKTVYISAPFTDAIITNVAAVQRAQKYDGKILTITPAETASDSCYISSGSLFVVNVADIDSGWGETYTPTADEIKAYFMGWTMYNGSVDANALYNGTGTKAWAKLWFGVGTPSTLSTRGITIVSESGTTNFPVVPVEGYTPYKLWYALANPVEEIIDTIGSLGCFAGQNTISVETGMVYEKVSPALSAINGAYYIAADSAKDPSVLKGGETKYKNKKIFAVYKNGVIDTKLEIMDYPLTACGIQLVKIFIVDFDPTAEYYIFYQMLPEEYNNQQISLTATYQQNLLGAHNVASETLENLQKQINKVELGINESVKATLTNWKTWKDWVPTLTWSTATPTIFVVTRYVIVGNMCNFTGYISTSNGGGATNLTITLPVAPKNTGQVVTVDMFELVGSTYTKVIGQIDTTNPANKIVLNNFAVATSGSAFALSFSGFYEI